MCRVIPVAVIAQQDLLAALPDIAKGWVGHAKADLCRRGAMVEPFPRVTSGRFLERPNAKSLGRSMIMGLLRIRVLFEWRLRRGQRSDTNIHQVYMTF